MGSAVSGIHDSSVWSGPTERQATHAVSSLRASTLHLRRRARTAFVPSTTTGKRSLTAAAIGAELLDPFEFASACLLQHTRSVYCLPRHRSPSRGLRRFQAGCALPTRSFQPLLGRPRPGSRRTARDHGVLCCNMVYYVAARAGGVDRWPARAAQLGEVLDLLLQATAGGDRQDVPCDMCARR